MSWKHKKLSIFSLPVGFIELLLYYKSKSPILPKTLLVERFMNKNVSYAFKVAGYR